MLSNNLQNYKQQYTKYYTWIFGTTSSFTVSALKFYNILCTLQSQNYDRERKYNVSSLEH